MKAFAIKLAVSVTVSVVGTIALNYAAKKMGSDKKWTFMHIEL